MKKRSRRKVLASILILAMLFGSIQSVFATPEQVPEETEFVTNYFDANGDTDELKAIEASLERYAGYGEEKSFDEAMLELNGQLSDADIAGQKSVYFDGETEEEIKEAKEKGIVKITIDAKAQLETTEPVDVMFVVDHSGTMNSNITPSTYNNLYSMGDTSASMNPNLLYRTVYKITDAEDKVSYVTYYFNPHEFPEGIVSWNFTSMKNYIDNSFYRYINDGSNNIDEELENKIKNAKSVDNQGDNKGYVYQMELYKYADGVNESSNPGRIFEIDSADYISTARKGFTTEENRLAEEKALYTKLDSLTETSDVHTTSATVAGNIYSSPYALSSDVNDHPDLSADSDMIYDRLYMTKSVTMQLADKLMSQGLGNRVGTSNFAGQVMSSAELNEYSELPAAFYDTAGYRNTNWNAGLTYAKEEFERVNASSSETSREQYVVFISDGKPTTGGTDAENKALVEDMQEAGIEVIALGINLTTADFNKMKSLGADISENVDTTDELLAEFQGIEAKVTTTPLSPTITDTVGEGFDLLIDADNPLSLEWNEDGEYKSIDVTSVQDFNKYGLTLSADEKTIIWESSKVNGEGTDTAVNGARISFYQNFDESIIDDIHFEEDTTRKYDTNNGNAIIGVDLDPNESGAEKEITLENPGAIKISGLSTITLEKGSNPTSGDIVAAEETISYSLVLNNVGNINVEGLEIKDFIPAGTEYLANGVIGSNGTYDANDNSISFTELGVSSNSSSEVQSFIVNVNTDEEGFRIANIATFGKAGVEGAFNEDGNPVLESNEVFHITATIDTPPVPPAPVPPTPIPPITVPPTPIAVTPPAAVAVVPPAAAVTIPPEATPLADGPTTIEDGEIPLAQGLGGAWSLMDLILTVITGLLAVSLLITYFKRKKEEEEESVEVKRKGLLRLLSAVPMIGAIILFILTQDMTLPMIIIDEWTIVFAAITLVQVGITVFSKKSVEEQEELTV